MLTKKAAAVNAKITKADTQAVTRAVFNAAGVDYPAAADTFRKADAIVTIDGLTFPAWKSTYCRNASPVYISDNMTGKMEGVPSMSTSCLHNPRCLARMKNGESICAHCFAAATLDQYKATGAHMLLNYILLSSHIIPLELLPHFGNVAFVRVESFGDVANVTHAINYLNIARVNPRVTFGWWSKNMDIIQAAVDAVGKPANVILIESAPRVNVKIEPSRPCVDKTFTVYDADHTPVEGINCGARCCVECRACYTLGNLVNELRESLK